MKIWFITLPLLFAAGFVHAESTAYGSADGGAISAPAMMESEKATQKPKMRKRTTARRLPHGDLRHCLDLGSNAEIIRCAETPIKR